MIAVYHRYSSKIQFAVGNHRCLYRINFFIYEGNENKEVHANEQAPHARDECAKSSEKVIQYKEKSLIA